MTAPVCPTRLRLVPDTTHEGALADILEPDRVITVRRRCDAPQGAATSFLQEGPRLLLGYGTADTLQAMFHDFFTPNSLPLLEDAIALVRDYCEISGLSQARMRLEQIRGDSCRRFHVDNVGLRMLCTYVGPGTEWVPPVLALGQNREDINAETIRRIRTGDVAILKGSAWSGVGLKGILHRSPPLSGRPEDERIRLLLTIDESAACGMAGECNPTVRR